MTTEWKRDSTGYYKEKSPDSRLDYGHDWTNWAEDSDAIVSSTWTADTGVTLSDDGVSGLSTYVYVDGGTVGGRYELSNTVTWSSGRIIELSFGIVVRDL